MQAVGLKSLRLCQEPWLGPVDGWRQPSMCVRDGTRPVAATPLLV